MKRIIILIAALSALSSTAWAKTQGNYVGANLINSHISYNSSKDHFSPYGAGYKVASANQAGLGVSYQYAFNFGNIYLAPGAFFDYNNISAKDNIDSSFKLKYRYGLKVDLGFDVSDKLAFYVTSGLANNDYVVKNSLSGQKAGNSIRGLLGIGAKYVIAKNISVNLAGELSSLAMKEPQRPGYNKAYSQNIDMALIRLGMAYNF